MRWGRAAGRGPPAPRRLRSAIAACPSCYAASPAAGAVLAVHPLVLGALHVVRVVAYMPAAGGPGGRK